MIVIVPMMVYGMSHFLAKMLRGYDAPLGCHSSCLYGIVPEASTQSVLMQDCMHSLGDQKTSVLENAVIVAGSGDETSLLVPPCSSGKALSSSAEAAKQCRQTAGPAFADDVRYSLQCMQFAFTFGCCKHAGYKQYLALPVDCAPHTQSSDCKCSMLSS